MTTLVIGAGLIGSQVARILAERGEKPVLMDHAAQPDAIGQIVDLAKVTLITGDIMRPLTIVDALRAHNITRIAHTAAYPMLTVGAQKEPYAAINLNIMGTVNVLEAARVSGLKRVVVSSSSVLNHYLDGGGDSGDFGKEEAFPRPTTFYSATKQAVESLGLNYAKWCGIEFAGLALRRGVRAVERLGRRRAVERDPRGDAERARRQGGHRAARRDGVGLFEGRRARHRAGARREGLRQRRVQPHHGRDDHAERDGRGDRRRGAGREGEVRGAGRHGRVAVEPRPSCGFEPGEADARVRAAVQVAGRGEGFGGVDAAVSNVRHLSYSKESLPIARSFSTRAFGSGVTPFTTATTSCESAPDRDTR